MTEKSLFITITGLTNAGKSSLLNTLTGEKIAAVTPKPQTTRTRITGIRTENYDNESIQYVFYDTPGVQPKPQNKLGEQMNKTVKDAENGVDIIIFVCDLSKKSTDSETNLLRSLNPAKTILLLNKTDTVKDKGEIADRIALLTAGKNFYSVIPVSVRRNDGMDILKNTLKKAAKPSVHFFPDDKFTVEAEESLAAEMIRENILISLSEEIPHGTAVAIEKFAERTAASGDDILDVEALIYCEKESHKGIIIGKKGIMLKKIGEMSRTSLENFFRIKVNLKLWVKVREDWRNREVFVNKFTL
ncbi:MAG: GTPase Era [Ruminococcus sp.]|jgi:GTP-binding protein Era|nr:GTPase Era [Ruminococcus sp.]